MGNVEFLTEAVRLATESVEEGWGGPFGAVITRDGEIIARGQNRVLLTGDPTAHAEVETIRKAVQRLNPKRPPSRRNTRTRAPCGTSTGRKIPQTRCRSAPGCSRAARSTSAARPARCA